MKLLIVTQVVDSNHAILGFFHRWIEEFAKHYEKVTVICLEQGDYSFPDNVTVHSLGKEKGKSRWSQLFSFYKLTWSLRKEYDLVFVHMNQIYVITGWLLWKLTKKKIGLWYTHGAVTTSLRVATALSDKIFTASPDSFNLKSDKVKVTGHGIDTESFAPETNTNKDFDLITIGRISRVKNLLSLITGLSEIRKSHSIDLQIVGTTLTEEDVKYKTELEKEIERLGLVNNVHFVGKVSQRDLPNFLNRSKIFVTAAQNGSLDKVMLEAMSCGLPVVSMAPGSTSLPLENNQVTTQADFVQAVSRVIESGNYQQSDYVSYIAGNHSLKTLIKNIFNYYV